MRSGHPALGTGPRARAGEARHGPGTRPGARPGHGPGTRPGTAARTVAQGPLSRGLSVWHRMQHRPRRPGTESSGRRLRKPNRQRACRALRTTAPRAASVARPWQRRYVRECQRRCNAPVGPRTHCDAGPCASRVGRSGDRRRIRFWGAELLTRSDARLLRFGARRCRSGPQDTVDGYAGDESPLRAVARRAAASARSFSGAALRGRRADRSTGLRCRRGCDQHVTAKPDDPVVSGRKPTWDGARGPDSSGPVARAS